MPSELTLPALLPSGFQAKIGKSTAWRVTSEPANLLKASLQQGVALTVAQLDGLKAMLGFTWPDPGKTKEGKKKQLKKIDKAKALLTFLFEDEWTADMLAAILGTKQNPEIKCPENLIAALGELERDEHRDFEHLSSTIREKQREMAARREQEQNIPNQRAPSTHVDAYEVRTFTPAALRDLLPPVQGVYVNRNPELKRYQASYPRRQLSNNFCLPDSCRMCSVY